MYTKLATNELLESKTPNGNVLLYFTASWCGPCQKLKPILKSIAEELTVVEIDVDDHGDLADAHEVQGIPLLKYVVDGDVAWKSVGVVTREEILSHVS
jgi:thioredoxin 1